MNADIRLLLADAERALRAEDVTAARDAFLEAIRGHSLAEASLIGRYAR